MKEIKEFIQELCDCAKPSANGSVVCLLYTSDAADEQRGVDLGGRRFIKKKKVEEKKKKRKQSTK